MMFVLVFPWLQGFQVVVLMDCRTIWCRRTTGLWCCRTTVLWCRRITGLCGNALRRYQARLSYPDGFQFLEEYIPVGHFDVHSGNLHFVVGVEGHRTKSEKGVGVLPLDFPDIMVPVS